MPGWLRAFVNANPVSHLVAAERGLMDGTAAAGQAGWVLLASAALVAIFGPITMRLYRRIVDNLLLFLLLAKLSTIYVRVRSAGTGEEVMVPPGSGRQGPGVRPQGRAGRGLTR